jgi:TonB family protein
MSALVVAAATVAANPTPYAAQTQEAPPQTAAPPVQAPAPAAQPDLYVPGRDRVQPPRVVSQVKPVYTAEAMRNRLQGTVRLRGIVERDGTVSNVEVINSIDTTYGLDQSAVDAFRQWRFEPATLDGNPVRVMVTMELTFALRETSRTPGWPPGFTVSVPPESVEESADARGLRLRLARPATWTRRSSPPNEWLGIRAGDSATYVSVLMPETAAFELRSPVADALAARLTETIRRSQPFPDAETLMQLIGGMG